MMKRRDLLGLMVGTALSGASGLAISDSGSATAASSAKTAGKRRLPWRNWSGSQQCLPAQRTAVASVEDLQQLIRSTTSVVRPVGAGHSFTPLVPTDDIIVSLSRLSGLVNHDPNTLQATMWAGSRLGDIGQPLESVGQALVNMPDIDEQTLAGCIGTATHGTGETLGCMSSLVTGMQLVDAHGEVRELTAQSDPELFQAARVSMGSMGVLTQLRLQNVAPYRLRRETTWRSFEELLESAPAMARSHRNFEFYYIPFTGMGFSDVHDFTDEPIGSTEKIDANDSVHDLKRVRDWLSWSPRLRELILGSYMKTLETEVTIESSWKNYASERNVRFNEMEYHLPREHGLQALSEIREALESKHPEVFFPIEVRFVAADDIWLSPFFERDSCSIAVHRFFEEDFEPFFKTIEPIFRKYQGRPHWGKLNTLTRDDFRALYPRWDDFSAVRRKMDPQGRFLNPYLSRLFA